MADAACTVRPQHLETGLNRAKVLSVFACILLNCLCRLLGPLSLAIYTNVVVKQKCLHLHK